MFANTYLTILTLGSVAVGVEFEVIGAMSVHALNDGGARLPTLRQRTFAEERTHATWGAVSPVPRVTVT